ncbi:hypothetical protein Enr13x_59650 [Stieleria neptunia]|uniref:Uncharacterized protein n=2 Tax=Stieleria neptunia TaxID=2527979 RepID=A0A518HYX5_9BACT|nr:hypothetical protein Enr13x_59650 [Stieleria neptunia]
MNPLAIAIGLVFGVVSAAAFYGVSMITSGLFARPFYRTYSRVLIGICCVMLLAPGLRLLASSNPMAGAIGLAMAQYLAMAILGYGVYRFNRDFIKRVFLRRRTTTFFIFGTLAYATVVTLTFLHVAVGGTPSWAGHGHGSITAAHYGPLLVLLAVMLFDTDNRLKSLRDERRRFSRFTFVGYAISFLGVLVSTVPFVADALHRLSSLAVDSPWIQSVSSAEALLIAIGLYGWLVWRYESIPPLFLLLLAIIAEYHVLVTQWVLQAFGPESWGLASLPLFAGITLLDHYFSHWDQRKRDADQWRIVAGERSSMASIEALRFATPFRIVQWGLAAALFGVTFWTHFYTPDVGPNWLGVTFAVYGVFFSLTAFVRRQPSLVYLAGGLAGLAAFFGVAPAGGPVATVVLAGIGSFAGLLAWVGERRGLIRCWRTPLADVSMVASVLVIGLVFSRHIIGADPYHFHAVGVLDAIALAGSMLGCIACAVQYRSQLPIYFLMIAAITLIPVWSAGLGLLAAIAATWIDHRFTRDGRFRVDDRVRWFDRIDLPLADELPGLLSRPLSLGGIPLALLGLAISIVHVMHADFSVGVLLGAAIAASVLLLLTRNYRQPWLYITGILATYFVVGAVAQGQWFTGWPVDETVAGQLTILSAVSLLGWLIAGGYAWWCTARLRRCAEEKEPSVVADRAYYSGWLFHVTALVALVPLAGNWAIWLQTEMPWWTMVSASLVAILFARAASVYRTQLATYCSLTALTLAVFSGMEAAAWFAPEPSTLLAGLSLLAALVSCFGGRRRSDAGRSDAGRSKQPSTSWLAAIEALPAGGLELWIRPLATYALVCSPMAVLASMYSDATWSLSHLWIRPAPLTFALASVTYLLSTRACRVGAIYIASVTMAIAAIHSAAQVGLNAGWFDVDVSGVHILVGAITALTSCLIASALTWAINRRLSRVDEPLQSVLSANREFYCGILQHLALLVAAFCLTGLAGKCFLDSGSFAASASVQLLTASVLATAFAVSGIVYLSRLQSYAALISILIAVLAGVAMWVGPSEHWAQHWADQTLAVALTATVFGIASWSMVPSGQTGAVEEDETQGVGMAWRFNSCWERPPLPFVSRDRTLWAQPLAHTSTIVAAAALVPLATLWGQTPIWMVVLPVFLASLVWLIATFTYGFGMLAGLDHVASPSGRSNAGLRSDLTERRLLYAASVLAFGAGVHLTTHLYTFATFSDSMALAWHLAIAAGLSLLGWCVATMIAAQRPVPIDTDAETSRSRESRELYSGVLQHVIALVGVCVLTVTMMLGLIDENFAPPLAIACGILAVFFALSGATYRSQVGSYLCLASLGWTVTQLTTTFPDGWGPVAAMIATSCGLLGLIWMAIAWGNLPVDRPPQLSSPRHGLLPTAWLSPPLPLRGDSWPSLWFNPLRQAGLLFAQIGVTMVVSNIVWHGSWAGWAMPGFGTLIAAAMVCAIGAKLYDSAVLTYIAAVLIAGAVFPWFPAVAESDPGLGVVWSLIAIVFWGVGYGVERFTSAALADDTDGPAELPLMRVYERPLIRSSAVLAIIAIAHSLYAWKVDSASASLMPMLVAGGVGTLTLLLGARSMNVLHRFSLGRLLVYLACLAVTVCVLVVASTHAGLASIGPAAAWTAVILSGLGLLTMEWGRMESVKKPHRAAGILTFARPLSNFGVGLAMAASLAAILVAVGTAGYDTGPLLITSLAPWLQRLALGPIAVTLTLAAAVSLLTVRASRNAIWLDVAVVLGSTGPLLLANQAMDGSAASLMLMALITMNGLVVMARLVQFGSRRFQVWLGLSDACCERSFYRWPLVVASGCLVVQSVSLLLIRSGVAEPDPNWNWLLGGGLCAALFFHVMYLRPHAALLHLMVASTVISFFGACLKRGWDVTPDVALSVMGFVWGMIAVQFHRDIGKRVLSILRMPMPAAEEAAAARALVGWAIGMTSLAVAITFPIFRIVRPEFPNLSVTLLFASISCLLTGVSWRNVYATIASAILWPTCLVATVVLYVDPMLSRDFAALATAGFAFGYVAIEFVFRRHASFKAGTSDVSADDYTRDVSRWMITLSNVMASIAVVITAASMTMLAPSPVFAIAMALVAVSWLWMAWESGREWLVYLSVAATFTSLIYLCTSLLGITFERSTIAAFFVVGYSFALYGLNILIGRTQNPRAGVFLNPTYHMALVSPVVLMLVTPLDQKGVAAFTSLAAGSFYLVVSHRTHARWTMYIAAALYNLAIYLWIPEAEQLTGLAQVYVIPAAVTVLIFAQLHRNDLEPRALSGIRSTAAGAILAVSTFEVFFQDDAGLTQFIVVLMLSLIGIAAGISLRIRPFVSIGIAFLVINVLGQLGLQFHREGGVIRAVILIGFGVLVLMAMIFFNIHRERILRRYRGFVADENWS